MSTPIIVHDPDGLIALAIELMNDNPLMTEREATNRAAEMIIDGGLDAFAAEWDAYAAAAGNPDAVEYLPICLVETAA